MGTVEFSSRYIVAADAGCNADDFWDLFQFEYSLFATGVNGVQATDFNPTIKENDND